jgi:hypothetical protein
VVPLKLRIAFAGVTGNIYRNSDIEGIIKDGVDIIKDRMEEIQDEQDEDEKIYFNPSRTAQNGINFITKELINELKNCEDERVKDLFRLLFIIADEEYSMPNVIKSFFDKMALQCVSFSKLF